MKNNYEYIGSRTVLCMVLSSVEIRLEENLGLALSLLCMLHESSEEQPTTQLQVYKSAACKTQLVYPSKVLGSHMTCVTCCQDWHTSKG